METDEIFSDFNFGVDDLPSLSAVILDQNLTREFNKLHLKHPKPSPNPRPIKEARRLIKSSGSMDNFVDLLLEKKCFLSEVIRAELSRYLTHVSPIPPSLRKKVS